MKLGDKYQDGTVRWKVVNRQDSYIKDESYINDFKILYPGGTKEDPSVITTNTRVIVANPFIGYYVNCKIEIYINNSWGDPCWYTDVTNNTSYSNGIRVNQYEDNNIIIQSGNNGIAYRSVYSGNPFSSTTSISSAPYRLKVWKIGKISDEQ